MKGLEMVVESAWVVVVKGLEMVGESCELALKEATASVVDESHHGHLV